LTRPVGDLAQLTNRAAPGRWRLAVRGSGATVPAATPSDRGPRWWFALDGLVRGACGADRVRSAGRGARRLRDTAGHHDLFVDDPPEFSTWSPAWTSWPSA